MWLLGTPKYFRKFCLCWLASLSINDRCKKQFTCGIGLCLSPGSGVRSGQGVRLFYPCCSQSDHQPSKGTHRDSTTKHCPFSPRSSQNGLSTQPIRVILDCLRLAKKRLGLCVNGQCWVSNGTGWWGFSGCHAFLFAYPQGGCMSSMTLMVWFISRLLDEIMVFCRGRQGPLVATSACTCLSVRALHDNHNLSKPAPWTHSIHHVDYYTVTLSIHHSSLIIKKERLKQ